MIRLVPGLPFPQPDIDLVLDDLEHRWVGADERREICGPHDQGNHGLNGDHGRRTDAYLQGRPFTDQLARTAFGHHSFHAVFADLDLGQAAEKTAT